MNFKFIKKSFTHVRKYVVGLNFTEHPFKICVGVIDLNGNKIASEVINLKGLLFSDKRYITALRQIKLQEFCILIFRNSLSY
jgi:hypothetical protein